MNVGKFLQLVCVWLLTISYVVGAGICLTSGGIVSLISAFFLFVGIVHVVKLFNGSILTFRSH